MIVTGNSWFSEHPTMPCGSWREFTERWLLPSMGRHGVDLATGISERVLPAHVNRGRCVVQCPCGGAEMAWEEGAFLCGSCFNAWCGHRLARSSFPAERREIEAILDRRPLTNRHWLLRETLEQLRTENIEHGLKT